jgi:tetratricopeptide (TPR) repeat protein
VLLRSRKQFAACLIGAFCLSEHTTAAPPNGTAKRFESQVNDAISHNNYDTAIRLATDGLRLAPNSPGLQFGRGWAYYRKGEIDSAIKDFNEATRLAPTFVRAYVLRGSSHMLKGHYEKALSDFNQAIRIDPRNAASYCDRADLEDSFLRRPGNALADYSQAIRLAPNFQRAYFNRGLHFVEQHDYARAIAEFTRAVELMPNDLDAYACRAYAYAKQGERGRAFADATVATKLKLTHDPLPGSVNLANRARAYRVLGQEELALHDLRKAVDLAPERPAANDNLAWFLASCPDERYRNGTAAVSAAKKACEASQWNSKGCYDTLAVAYAEAGDFDQAAKYEKQALNDSSLATKEREHREKRLALFQQRKPFRDEF